jgi:hypothetical protein
VRALLVSIFLAANPPIARSAQAEPAPAPRLDFDLLPPEPAAAPVDPALDRKVARRKQMLRLHRGLGIATWSALAATVAVGQLDLKREEAPSRHRHGERPALLFVKVDDRVEVTATSPLVTFAATADADGVTVVIPRRRDGSARGSTSSPRAVGRAHPERLHSASAGAPPERATSSRRILPGSIPRARFVICSNSSSMGGAAPFMKRSGFTRATTKALR